MSRNALRAVILTLVCSLGMSYALSGQASAITPGSHDQERASLQSDLVSLVNGYRAANGLGAVGINGALSSAAAWMATDMAAKNYFSHTSSDGRSPQQRMAAFGYPAYALFTGENIAAGQASAADVLAGWQASPAHNTILLSPNFNAIGVGYAYSAASSFKSYWVADFGGPGGNVAPAPVPAPVAVPAPVPAPVAAITVPALTVAAPAPVTPAPESADPAAASAGPAPADQSVRPEATRAATVPRGDDRGADAHAAAVKPTEVSSMRRLLHLLAVLERLGH